MKFLVFLLALWVAAGLQYGLNLRCDLPLVILVLASMGLPRPGSTAFGFLTGLVQGSLAMANLAAYAISRTLTGFFIASFVGMGLQPGALVAGATALAATMVAQGTLMFIAPPPSIPSFLLDTMISAVYNGVIATVLFLAFRKMIGPTTR